jgi:hypothetical protein
MRTPDRFRRLVERLLPWFDVDAEQRRNERTEAIRQRSIAARLTIEHLSPEAGQRIRAAYRAYGHRIAR